METGEVERPRPFFVFCFNLLSVRRMDEEMQQGSEDTTCNHEGGCNCEAPAKEASVATEAREEIALAFLLALMPLVVLTFFGQVGLI